MPAWYCDWCLTVPRPLGGNRKPICPRMCQFVCPPDWVFTCLSVGPYVIRVSFNKQLKKRTRVGCSVKVEVIQRDTTQCLMTHYNYTYSSPLAEQWKTMQMVLCWGDGIQLRRKSFADFKSGLYVTCFSSCISGGLKTLLWHKMAQDWFSFVLDGSRC